MRWPTPFLATLLPGVISALFWQWCGGIHYFTFNVGKLQIIGNCHGDTRVHLLPAGILGWFINRKVYLEPCCIIHVACPVSSQEGDTAHSWWRHGQNAVPGDADRVRSFHHGSHFLHLCWCWLGAHTTKGVYCPGPRELFAIHRCVTPLSSTVLTTRGYSSYEENTGRLLNNSHSSNGESSNLFVRLSNGESCNWLDCFWNMPPAHSSLILHSWRRWGPARRFFLSISASAYPCSAVCNSLVMFWLLLSLQSGFDI